LFVCLFVCCGFLSSLYLVREIQLSSSFVCLFLVASKPKD
jgi:hypothetical protein